VAGLFSRACYCPDDDDDDDDDDNDDDDDDLNHASTSGCGAVIF
jgi:hypothetical protein